MSDPFSVQDLLCWTHGQHLQGELSSTFRGVSIDTRTISPGMLFIAIHGEHHDAHHFLAQAAEKGAAGLLIEANRALPDSFTLPVVAVPDTTLALGQLAAGHRARFDGPLIAITGSNGKTTTKEICSAILNADSPCLTTMGNLNNQFGLPLTLLRREPDHTRAVVEIGMNHVGEIRPLAKIAKPTIAIITNIGAAHIGFMGSLEAIAREKGDLLVDLQEEHTAILNADDPRVLAQQSRTVARIQTFSIQDRSADFFADQIEIDPIAARVRFQLHIQEASLPIQMTGLDHTTVSNALAAIAAARTAGIPLKTIQEGISSYQPAKGRMQRISWKGVTLLDDTYNANPQSMTNALQTVVQQSENHRAIAVLGDMGELGEETETAHFEIGRKAGELGIDFLLLLGESAASVQAGALQAGMRKESVKIMNSHSEISALLRTILSQGDWVILKGSRAMQMERVIEQLCTETG